MSINETKIAPKAKLEVFKRTKIIATVGPSTSDYKSIKTMMDNGVNGFRFNFSHGNNEERLEQFDFIRKASREIGKPVAIIQDLQGPKIRIGDIEDIKLSKGKKVKFGFKVDYEKSKIIPVQYDISKSVKKGDRLLLADGTITCKVVSVNNGVVTVNMLNSGILKKRKGMNLPDTNFSGRVITSKDKQDVVWGTDKDIDFVALSFVQTADDILELKRILKNHNSKAKVIAKVETKIALENLDEITKVSDGVMVARGDLAMEVSPEAVPIAARKIIGLAQEHNTISIVATQMLSSMTNNIEPTRAEVSDIATAVIVGADCVMLSDETASGEYPIESVKVMKRVILYTQDNQMLKPDFYREEDTSIQGSISSAIITLSHQVGARAIVAQTKSGATALNISSRRPTMPLIVISSDKYVVNQMSILYGAMSFWRPATSTTSQKLTAWLYENRVFKKGDTIVSASGRQPGMSGGTDTIKVRKIGQ